MRTKEEYYEDTLKNRALLESQEVLNCSCPYSRCEWHGKCRECVALHRYHAEHLPCCLQPLLREKITVLAGCCEMETTSIRTAGAEPAGGVLCISESVLR